MRSIFQKYNIVLIIVYLVGLLLVPSGKSLFAQSNIVDFGIEIQHGDIGVADLNQDGQLDVIITGQGGTGVFLNNGDSTFTLAEQESEITYTNPVFEPDLADPTIIRAENGWFYAYGTENRWPEGYQVVPIIKSEDLVNWEYVGEAFNKKPDWKNGGIWAPSIHFVDSLYYLYYSYSTWGDDNPGIGLAIAEVPEGPFIDRGKLLDTQSSGVKNSIDPYLFTENGKNYLFWGSLGGGIYGIPLSFDGKRIIGDKFRIAGNSFEAVYIDKKEEYYYLYLSTASCCDGANSVYRVVVGRSKNLAGPFLTSSGHDLINYNNMWWVPVVDNIKGVIIESNDNIAGPGHNAQIITDDRGDDWFVYHAILKSNPNLPGGATRRPLFIDRIDWEDGWPVINAGMGPSYEERQQPFFNIKY